MKPGSYHDSTLAFLKANPKQPFSAKELGHAIEPTFDELGVKTLGMNNVLKEIMFRHSPFVHQSNMRKNEGRKCFHYWFDDSHRNDTFQEGGGPSVAAPPAPLTPLELHFKAMQDMLRRYLEPVPYINREGASSKVAWGKDQAVRDAMFANDMAYMLAGPEAQRAQAA